MNVVVQDLEISADNPVTFVPMSDIHIGHVDCDLAYFQNTVNWIKKKGALTVLLGDTIDAIGMRDKRFEVSSVDPFFLPYLDQLYQKQVEVFLDIIRPIKDQILWITWGNHETTIKKRSTFDAIDVISKALNIPILTDPGYSGFKFHSGGATCSLRIWSSHGCFMGGRYRGSKVNTTHDKWVIEGHQVRLTKNMKIEERRCYFANTGAFLRTYQEKDTDTWASRNVFSPQVPGVVRFDFYLKRRADDVRYIDVHGRV
jgi:UDP-2,3-diacylglucosamine pyrophosphatase LpxH